MKLTMKAWICLTRNMALNYLNQNIDSYHSGRGQAANLRRGPHRFCSLANSHRSPFQLHIRELVSRFLMKTEYRMVIWWQTASDEPQIDRCQSIKGLQTSWEENRRHKHTRQQRRTFSQGFIAAAHRKRQAWIIAVKGLAGPEWNG